MCDSGKYLFVEFELKSCVVFSWVWCEKCSGGFVCVYVKIVYGGPLVNFVEVWLKELLGLTMFSVGCCDCYIISVCCELNVFRWMWDVRSVNVEKGRRENSTLWYTSVDTFEFRVCVVVLSACLSSLDVVCNSFYDRVRDVC